MRLFATTRFAHIAKYLAAEKAVQVPELEDADGIQLLTRFAPEVLQTSTIQP